MMNADEIMCRVPAETAIKISELYCSVSRPISSANSQTWANWFAVVVAALGSIATIAAVFVAIRQASDAKIIAANSNADAINRELLARQWDRYEAFSRETIRLAQAIGKDQNTFALTMTELTHAGNSYSMYLHSESEELGREVIEYSDVLQGIGRVTNDWNGALAGLGDISAPVQSWFEKHPNYQMELMQNSALVVNELRNYHRGGSTAEETAANLRIARSILESVHRPLLVYYERARPSFMRKYS